MKKILGIVLAVFLLASLVSCLEGDDSSNESKTSFGPNYAEENNLQSEPAKNIETGGDNTAEDFDEPASDGPVKESQENPEPETPVEIPEDIPEETPEDQPQGQKADPATPAEETQEPIDSPAQDKLAETPVQSSGTFVGSVDSNKYHNPGCRFAKNILPKNEIWFDTREAAQAAGYEPCGVCQ